MKGRYTIPLVLVGALLVTACSEQERREIREQEARIAQEQAEQQRILQEHVATLAAETQRRRNAAAAETERRRNAEAAITRRNFHHRMSVLGQFATAFAVVGGLLAWVVYSLRRLGEKHSEERTKRHQQNLVAISGDPNLSPQNRDALYGRAIEAASQGGGPILIGYSPNNGDDK